MRFVDTYRFAPVANKMDLPDKDDYFHMTPDEITPEFLVGDSYDIDEAWWWKQRDRCINGYTVPNAIEPGGEVFIDGVDCFWSGNDCYIPMYDLHIKNREVHLTGYHYFYLNFFPMYREKEGKLTKGFGNPDFLAMDFFFFHRFFMMLKLEKDGQELKSRQLGFSMKLACLAAWVYTFNDDSQTIIVSGIEEDAEYTFDIAYNALGDLINTQFYKEKGIDRKGDLYIKSKNTGSFIKGLTAKDKPQTVSRFSPFLVIYEEIGKGRKGWSELVSKYAKPALYTLQKKTGWQLFIGTAGEPGEGIEDMETRHYNAEKKGLLAFENVFEKDKIEDGVKVSHFTAKDWFKIIDKDGNPLREEGRKLILEARKNMTAEDAYADTTQNALYASDAFLTPTAGFFGETTIGYLNERKRKINTFKELRIVRRGVLEFINPKKPFEGCIFTDSENGWLEIIEEPERDSEDKVLNNLYWGGVDSYDQDEAHTSNSKGALYIRKMFNPNSSSPHYNTYVAQIVERPKVEEGGAELFYMHCAMTAIYFNCLLNIEYSNLRIFQWMEDHGFESLLFERPQLAFAGKIADSQVSNRYGTDKSLKPQILAITRDRLTREFINNLFFVTQIDKLAKFKYDPSGKKYNCDVTIATAEAEVAAKEEEFTVVKSSSQKPKKESHYEMTKDGQLIEVYE